LWISSLLNLAAVVIGSLLIYWRVGKWSRKLTLMASEITAIESGGQGELTAVDEPVEIQSVAVSFNQLLKDQRETIAREKQFIADASHELRTPLNSLLILSKLLVDNPKKNLTPKQVEYAKTIYSSGNDLLSLINDLLDLAKIESGKMTVNAGKMVLSDVAAFVESYFKPVADEKRLPFRITIDDDVPSSIYSDEVRVEQVLKNLLSNAFKFTSEGEVRLEISTDKVQGAGTPMIAFAVTDTGIGIPEEKKQIIFNAFQQADGTTSRKYGGTGLGLSISKEIAELLGGKITVSSQKGKGSTFTFYVGEKDYPAKQGLQKY